MPFSMLGIAFIVIGIIMNDRFQILFGLVWIAIAIVVLMIKGLKAD